jgi:ankyrin repeat protein
MNDRMHNLYDSVRKGNIAELRLYLQSGGNPNAVIHNEHLLYINKDKNLDVYKLLIEYGTDVNVKNSVGNTILHKDINFPEYKIPYELYQLVLNTKKFDINSRGGGWGESILQGVTDVKSLESLLKFGVNPNIRNYDDETPLMVLAGICKSKSNCRKLIELLALYGTDVNYMTKEIKTRGYVSRSGSTALSLFKDKDLKELLVLMGAKNTGNIKILEDYVVDYFSRTNTEYINTYLKNGGDPNMVIETHTLINFIDVFEPFKVLVDAGADWRKMENLGTPFYIRFNGDDHFKMVNYIMFKFPGQLNVNRLTKMLFYQTKITNLKFLLENKANPNTTNYLGKTPIYDIMYEIKEIYVDDEKEEREAKHAIEVLTLLSKYRINIDHRDNQGNTLMHFMSNKTVMNFLYKNGASIDIKNNLGVSVREMVKSGTPHYENLRLNKKRRGRQDGNIKKKVARYIV